MHLRFSDLQPVLRRAVPALSLLAATAVAEENLVELSRVIVTATPSERPLTVITDPKVAAQPIPAHDGAEALRSVPGFSTIRKAGTDGDPVFRGMAGSRLGILLDGETILGGCGNRMDPPTAYVFPSAYDRITILKGPQSVIHGPGNSAGVVRFERTPQPYSVRAAALESALTFGSFGRNDQYVDVRAGTSVGYGRLAVTRSASDDYRDGSDQAVSSRYKRWSTHLSAAWTPDEHTLVDVSGVVSDGEAAYADRAMDGTRFARRNLGFRFHRQNISPLLAAVEASVFTNEVDHVMDNFSLRTFLPTATMPGRAVSNPDRRTNGGRAAATLTVGESLRLISGIDYQQNRHRLRSTANEPNDPYQAKSRSPDGTFEVTGIFAEATHTLMPARRVVVGGRLDRWHARDQRSKVMTGMMGSAANPTANQPRDAELTSGFARYEHDIFPSTTGYFGIGHAQRFPDYWELFSKESATTLSAFRTRPERTTQLDLGVTHRAGSFAASVALFASRVDDFILIETGVAKVAAMGAPRMVTIARNVDAATHGGEASLAYTFGAGWKIDASVASVRGENRTDGRPLAQQPPLESRLGVNYATGIWSVGALARMAGAQNRFARNQGNIVGQDLGPTAGFAVFSVNVGWKISNRALFTAGADNVLDRTYAEHLSRGASVVVGFPPPTVRINEPGRMLWVKLQLKL